MVSSAQLRLREATRADHDRLERRVDVLAAAACPDRRRALVARFHAMHAEAEAAIAPWLAGLPDLDFEARRRTARLSADLAELGVEPAPLRPVDVGSRGEALGRMYVLEGSALGGRVIRRGLQDRGLGLEGLSFLDPYGERLGERWRSFLAVLDAEAARPETAEAMVAGAVAGFRHAERTLCGDRDG